MTIIAPRTEPGRLHLAGRYGRIVRAGLERVWENVFDWEHLPSLHAHAFASVELLDRDATGFRARVAGSPEDARPLQLLELRADVNAGRYAAVTLEGPGAGLEVHTRLRRLSARRTAVAVAFLSPEASPERLARVGARLAELYARLWDEDEAMMIARERALAARKTRSARPLAPLRLGRLGDLRARLPLDVAVGGQPFRLVEIDGELSVFSTVCPHWLGPLDTVEIVDGCVACPWHGYRFEVRTGHSADGRGLRLAAPPRIVISGDEVQLVPA